MYFKIFTVQFDTVKKKYISKLSFQYIYMGLSGLVYILYLSYGYNFRIKNAGSYLIPYTQINGFQFLVKLNGM